MQSLRERRGLVELTITRDEQIETERNTRLCSQILEDRQFYSMIERTGFVFKNILERGTVNTVQDLLVFFTYEGRRMGMPDCTRVRNNIYNIDWMKSYVTQLDCLRSAVITQPN